MLVTLTGCVPQPPQLTPTHTVTRAPSTTTPSIPSRAAPVPVQPSGEPTTIQSDLHAPWSIVPLPSGSVLIDDRDSGTVLERLPDGSSIRTVGVVPGVVHSGEGGLLGLAVQNESAPRYLYAYLTTDDDNRVVRMPLSGVPGSYAIGAPQPIITGIPKGIFHNGGRIAFGPDRMLYITAGDGTNTANAQNKDSLGGKILRVTPTGEIPHDNPFAGSPVYSLGHRNPQGIAWDSHGTMWASEFGQDTWDELNIIRPGGNYGWPTVEGIAHNPAFIDPVYQWPTDAASPSGLAIVNDTIFMAGLGGQRLWVIYPTNGGAPVRAVAYYANDFGRLRDVVGRGSDTLWMLTNNTDGRGDPRAGDDRILSVPLVPRS
jgi:glucose/arabinose dehydrogenase